MTYTQYVFHNNTLITKFKTDKDNLEDIWNTQSKPLMLDSMRKYNVTLTKQINTYSEYCKVIEKQIFDSYKVSRGDLLIYNTCYSALVKFGKRDHHDCIFLKHKKKKKKKLRIKC